MKFTQSLMRTQTTAGPPTALRVVERSAVLCEQLLTILAKL